MQTVAMSAHNRSVVILVIEVRPFVEAVGCGDKPQEVQPVAQSGCPA